jgi:hypothetical protein
MVAIKPANGKCLNPGFRKKVRDPFFIRDYGVLSGWKRVASPGKRALNCSCGKRKLWVAAPEESPAAGLSIRAYRK